ncbi:hypothetical protein MSM1_17570 [Mycobacterium sp. SM1]|uniref:hypothetical protein n=1 Tax=Mycobacterium sp. SM1 TaxID=2816243 RepID=UPI001BCC2C3A|nr:hypothetical protein [Mycobacterium sp. SM1]MBS4730069.1 hypothetical protein [Mycobacterium sp. SM1]
MMDDATYAAMATQHALWRLSDDARRGQYDALNDLLRAARHARDGGGPGNIDYMHVPF